MPITAVTQWSNTAANNTDLAGILLGEGLMARVEVNNAFRELMKQVADYIDAPVFNGAPKEAIFTITDGAAFEIDPANGSLQFVTLGANRTPKATNFENGESVVLFVNDGSSRTLTLTDTTFGPSGIDWKDGAPITLDATNWTAIVFFKEDGQIHAAPGGVYA